MKAEMSERREEMRREFEERTQRAIEDLEMAQNERTAKYEARKESVRRRLEMQYEMASWDTAQIPSKNAILKAEEKRTRILLEVKALTLKRKELEQNLRKKIRSVQDTKREIAELKRSQNRHSAEMEEETTPKKDRWQIGSVGEISKNGGAEWFVSLKKRKKKGFRGLLHFGDRIELLSEQGFVNKTDNTALCCRVKVVSAKNKKSRAQIGFVQLTQTTFFTSRALHDS